MVKAKGRLQAALAREKGTDYERLKQKRKHKDAVREKRKASSSGVDGAEQRSKKKKLLEEAEEHMDVDEEVEDDEKGDKNLFDVEAEISGEDSEDDEEDEEEEYDDGGSPIAQPLDDESSSESELDELEDADEEGIDMEEIEDELDEDEDIVPFQRTTINNTTALLASLKRLAIPTSKEVPFSTHQVVVSDEATETAIPDISDDTNRELRFLAQAMDAARKGRDMLRKEGVAFTRPHDYFAEMLKPDEQMGKIKAKLIEDATAKKASAEARKQRDLKKFGKQVQVLKQQERAKEKRETLEKIKTLKRKRAEGGGDLGVNEAEDLFDVAIDNELAGYDKKSGAKRGDSKKRPGAPHGASNAKRQRKDAKYGFGGKKKYSKSGDAMSSGDLSSFSTKRMKGKGGSGGKAPRLGKSRRKAAAGRG